MLRADKEKIVNELKEKLVKSKSLFLADFTGLKVDEMNQLRRSLEENEVEIKVAKNSLLKLAAKQAGIESVGGYLKGPTAVVFGHDRPTTTAKLLYDSIKKIEKPKMKMLLVEGKIYPSEEIKRLALIPSREVLLAQIAGSLNAPLANLALTLEGPIREFIMILEGIALTYAKTKVTHSYT